MPNPFPATRYHSLVIYRNSLPACLEITADTEEGEIMGSGIRNCLFGECSSIPKVS